VRKELYGLTPTSRGADIYSDDATEKTYDELLRRATDVLERGGRVIVDATFRRRAHRDRFRARGASLGARFVILSVICDEGVVARRLSLREHDPLEVSDARLGEYHRLAPEFDPLSPDEGEIITIDTSRGEVGIEEVITRLGVRVP